MFYLSYLRSISLPITTSAHYLHTQAVFYVVFDVQKEGGPALRSHLEHKCVVFLPYNLQGRCAEKINICTVVSNIFLGLCTNHSSSGRIISVPK